jgi:hypothetical protein
MMLIIFLGLIAKLVLVSGDCDDASLNLDDFDWDEVRISVLTSSVQEAAVHVLNCFNGSFKVLFRSVNKAYQTVL